MKTQGRKLIEHLKRRPHTYMEMLMYGISVCPQKRIVESLQDDEHLFKRKNSRGLTTWYVTR